MTVGLLSVVGAKLYVEGGQGIIKTRNFHKVGEMFFKKLVDPTSVSSTLIKRCFQTVRNIEPEAASPTAGLVERLGLNGVPLSPKQDRESPAQPKEVKVANILEEVKVLDGLPPTPSHIEHIIGRATKGRIYQKQGLFPQESIGLGGVLSDPLNFAKSGEKFESGGIDIADKTQLILQSPHPVRYVIEKEIYNSQKGLRLRLPSYHTWITLFGRSLVNRYESMGDTPHNTLLDSIANASDSGMFSADIHHTILDIPENHSAFGNSSNQYHMGNKYAVLVGDYFAIRCIYHAERTKTNSVMVAITEGVEEFTTCSFGTNLFDPSIGYPSTISPNASILDWILYNQKAFGYLKGGLNATLSLHSKESKGIKSNFNKDVEKLIANLSVFLKASAEIDAVERNDCLIPSPFLLTSLPAILCQMENPQMFSKLRISGYELNADYIEELHDHIRRTSLSTKRTRNLIIGFASETKQAFHRIAKDEYYRHVFDSLVDVVAEES